MRVCLVTVAGPMHGLGGMQDHTADLARSLVRAGHEAEVITSRSPDGRPEVTLDGIRWRFVDAPGFHLDRRWLSASFEAFREEHRARPYDLVHGEGSSALELVRRGVHRELPVVTMFHGNFLGLARAAIRRMRTAPGALPRLREARHLVHLCGEHFPRGNWYRLRGCEAIVPSHQQLRDTCRSHLLDPRRVHVVPNGVDTERFRPRPRDEARRALGLPDGPLLVCVGRLNREKGIEKALRALARVEDASLVVVGDGEERDALERLASELGVAGRTRFVGAQPHETVAAHVAAGDAFLFPTERDEAAPLVLPQAMACGRPVIASATGGIPEVIDRPGENGVLVPPGDVDALAAAIRRVLADPPLAERIGEAARRRAVAEYSLERMTERTLEVYAVAAGRGGPASIRGAGARRPGGATLP